MQPQELSILMDTLSPEERATVEEFIRLLKKQSTPITFQSALDSFAREHPELLRRLAQ